MFSLNFIQMFPPKSLLWFPQIQLSWTELRLRKISRAHSWKSAEITWKRTKWPKSWPEITWKNVPPTSNWCKSPAVEIAQIFARNYAKERAANVKLKARVRGPAVEIAEILARNYVKTIQLDLESSGEIFMYLLVKCRKLWTFLVMMVRIVSEFFVESFHQKATTPLFTWN